MSAAPAVLTVPVALGERAYEVRVGPGLLATAGEAVRALFPRPPRLAVVADAAAAALHGPALLASLRDAGLQASVVEVPPGEGSKSWAQLARVVDALLALELDRGDAVAAFGGGVTGDLAGFAAAVFKRGIAYVQVPTTLLAQVDSSVGGKTAIDTPRGKNLVGAFHQPRLVLADTDTLATLPPREVRAGYAEVLKHGLLGDRAYFERLEREGAAVLAREPAALAWAVAGSVRLKAAVVARDEREGGARALLNLGHTFGHAFEAEAGPGTPWEGGLVHGEAVGLGCALAFRFSAALGLCPPDEAARAVRAVAAAGLPVRMEEVVGAPFSAERLAAHMAQDKKTERGALTFVLARRIGEAFVAKGVERESVLAFLRGEGAV